MKQRITVLFILLFSFSCDRESAHPDSSLLGLEYFPLFQGSYRVYDAQQIEYTVLGEEISTNYQLKEETFKLFQNDDEEEIYPINRYIRKNENEEWILDAVWSARNNNYLALITEENIPFQKLAFPVNEGVKWNGNAFNTYEQEEYYYQDIGQNFTTDIGDEYTNTVIVVQNDLLDKIVKTDYRIEVYAKNIGLIHKETTQLSYCTDPDCLGLEIVESGLIYRQSLIDYGQN